MTAPATRTFTLRIEGEPAQIRGTIGDEAGASREFSGWLGLARALELALGADRERDHGEVAVDEVDPVVGD